MLDYITLSLLSEIVEAAETSYRNNSKKIPIKGIKTDTRTLLPGEIFLALRGQNFDGHGFVDQAIKKDALAVITDQYIHVNTLAEVPQLIVKNTLESYQKIASWWRQQLSIPVIGVTGSVGKTTTKELIAAVLSKQGKVLKTTANYNNEIGVPKTLLEIDSGHKFAVIEMGMRARGEIALLTQVCQPDIAVITNVGTAHIGRLGSESAIAEAKCELLALMPRDSVAILNGDNPLLLKTAKKVWSGRTLTYGLESGDLRGIIEGEDLVVDGMRFPLPLAGRHHASNYLAAIAVGKVLGLDLTFLESGIEVQLPDGRGQRHEVGPDVVLLDETYNAGLESMLAALELLAHSGGKRRVAVLGTMKELGEHSAELHRRVGRKVRELGIDRLLVLVDDRSATQIAVGAANVETRCYSTKEELIAALRKTIAPGDRILFKASHSVGLNEVVSAIHDELNP
ncbi:MAG: UDP-N-acetylmuramoyl-tripeptide--D-alanyl-D-alanine ligase [Chroococcopsis gigantea SAG 12.99]|jgi:UDP-N-acetylmuramoyl-tripeptide--D-alanyl-D-alanine ligase|nr:UDP-N-acetylmuramoyl-tripeptide--D-alanyl-D-alanine ligase [Chroococcopsis gigantea SAG 12.99]